MPWYYYGMGYKILCSRFHEGHETSWSSMFCLYIRKHEPHVQFGQLQVSCARAQVQLWPSHLTPWHPNLPQTTLCGPDHQADNWDWATTKQHEEGRWSDLKQVMEPSHSVLETADRAPSGWLRCLLSFLYFFNFLSITNKMQCHTIFFITVNALHISGGFSAHQQELKNCTHSIKYMSSLLAATASVGGLFKLEQLTHAVCTVF